jgi:hypothetical protein
MLPKLRSGKDLRVGIEFLVTVDNNVANTFESELRMILEDLGLTDKVRLD